MNEDRFWQLISRLDWQKTGDDDAVIEPTVMALAEQSADDIRGFADLLAEKLHALDTRQHARAGFPRH